LLLTLTDATHAKLQWAGIPVPPFELVRTGIARSVSTDWDECKTYSPDDVVDSNPEMERIFNEDQRDRKAGVKINWQVVGKSDAERRSAVMSCFKRDRFTRDKTLPGLHLYSSTGLRLTITYLRTHSP
jgi:hypothetical protein